MNRFSSSSSSSSSFWGVGKLSSDGNGVTLLTGSLKGSGGVTLIINILSYCPIIIVTSLGLN
jgi:hypothetical protein